MKIEIEDEVIAINSKYKAVRRLAGIADCRDIYEITSLPQYSSTSHPYALSNINGLTEITVGDFVSVVSLKSLYNTEFVIQKVVLPDTVRHISSKSFACSGLQEINIPSNIGHIGDSAFWGCEHLSIDLVLPDVLHYLGTHSFECSGIKSVKWCSNYFNDMNVLQQAFSNCNELSSVTMSNNGHIKLDKLSFNTCVSLTNVSFNTPHLVIGSSAFIYCKALKELDFGGTKSIIIMEDAFKNCTSLAEIVFPKSITALSIHKDAFRECSALKQIKIPTLLRVGLEHSLAQSRDILDKIVWY